METDSHEIDEGTDYVGYHEAFEIIASNVPLVGTEEILLDTAAGRVAAADLVARISYPQTDVSLKDGFAVISEDIDDASFRNPVSLEVVGSVFAGGGYEGKLSPGHAVKICSGAPIPKGANAVVSVEFCEELPEDRVKVHADAGEGRNVLRNGAEVKGGEKIVQKGGRMLPGSLGLAAAAGLDQAVVYLRPKVAMLGVGDEVVAPGERLHPGQLYASNLVTMEARLAYFGITYVASVVKDIEDSIQRELKKYLPLVDVILTSGGAWGSERDLVVGVLDRLGWRKLFHHVRMGPGKGIAFGIWEGKPVFCLPGGPASNEMAFLQLALPGILRMGGDTRHPLPTVYARLAEDTRGRHSAWTEFKDAVLTRESDGSYSVGLYRNRSRLQAIASANSLICVPEGQISLDSGQVLPVQLLVDRTDDL